MSKELEAFNRLALEHDYKTYDEYDNDYETVNQALQRLESIDNAKPSEALKDLDKMVNQVFQADDEFELYYNKVKQYILKAQEQEKENVYIEKIKIMMKQKDCVLRYIESEDCFAVKTILSDGWYKLTPEFVDNNIREEIKPLPLIEKNKQLKEENAEYKKVLEIIKEKPIESGMAINYYIKQQLKNNIVVDYKQYKKTICDLSQIFLLTQEEFDLLKRWLG